MIGGIRSKRSRLAQPQPGKAALAKAKRRALELRDGHFVALCRQFKIPAPLREMHVMNPATGRWWRVDFTWPEKRVALEVEGGAFIKGGGRHNRGASFVDEMDKYNRLALLATAFFASFLIISVT